MENHYFTGRYIFKSLFSIIMLVFQGIVLPTLNCKFDLGLVLSYGRYQDCDFFKRAFWSQKDLLGIVNFETLISFII